MWRPATPDDTEQIVAMCLSLYIEDAGEEVTPEQVRRTLEVFREEPIRGRALVATREGAVVGYALLASFWSNEYGGEICTVDELYILPAHRNRGIGRSLFDAVRDDRALWPRVPVALELEVSPTNQRARALYTRLGFTSKNQTMRRKTA